MRYYVYALIDPTRNNSPFYIGKGLDNRLQSHFKSAERVRTGSAVEVIGCDTRSVVEDAISSKRSERLDRINGLRASGFDHAAIGRIIARRLDERTALAIEAFLIRNVYGLSNLTNRVEGAYAERFRSQAGFIDGFDITPDSNRSQLQQIESRFGRHYVYTLTDPSTNRVFYVGKGTDRRMFEHFSDAAKVEGKQVAARHLQTIRKLLRSGCRPNDICQVEARLESEQQAFAIESLLIKFVHGLEVLENRVSGKHGTMFRAKGDWSPRRGFDLPYVCDPGKQADRSDKQDGMVGEGLAIPLLAIEASVPDLVFDPPRVLDASELGIEADIRPRDGGAGARIKVFIRRRKLQVELRPRKKAQREWVREHFSRLGAYPLRRKDDVFFPDAWRGPANMTDDLEEITRRIHIMQDIVNARSVKELTHEAITLLPRPTLSPG